MHSVKKHHMEDLDGTKGAWRPALTAGLIGPDGHPASFNEMVVMTCPRCGGHFGVGADDVKIQEDGTTTGPVRCPISVGKKNEPCGWVSEGPVKFEGHAEPHGREHFAKLQEQAHKDVVDGRIRGVQKQIQADLIANLHEHTLAEAKKILPDGDPNHAELFRNFMKGRSNKE